MGISKLVADKQSFFLLLITKIKEKIILAMTSELWAYCPS